jgi:hypothetical protein
MDLTKRQILFFINLRRMGLITEQYTELPLMEKLALSKEVGRMTLLLAPNFNIILTRFLVLLNQRLML